MVSADALEQSLKDLPSHGTMIKDRGYRQVWRFVHADKPYYLKFYPRAGLFLKRLVRGNPAMREFTRLQLLQKANVPSPRAVAVLVGFRLNGAIGDAVIIEGIEPSVQLDHYLSDLQLEGRDVPNRAQLLESVCDLLGRLGGAGLGHADLHLGNFLLRDGKVYLLDGYAVRRGGLRTRQLALLGHSTARFTTTADVVRVWRALGGGAAIPARRAASPRFYRKFLQRVTRDNRYFGKLTIGSWSGHFFGHAKFPRRWSAASRLEVTREDWLREWPNLLSKLESDQFDIIKRSPSGDVLSGGIALNGRPVAVVIKRPRKKSLWRHISSVGRASRVRRSWIKAWKLFIRQFPVEFPLLVMERRVMGYVTDGIIVFERMKGIPLSQLSLDELSPGARDTLLRRLGRTLRKLEEHGFTHFDSKFTNWIINMDDPSSPLPILIDVDGIRHYRWNGFGIRRLLRSMRDHPEYRPADSLALCLGYAPHAQVLQEPEN